MKVSHLGIVALIFLVVLTVLVTSTPFQGLENLTTQQQNTPMGGGQPELLLVDTAAAQPFIQGLIIGGGFFVALTLLFFYLATGYKSVLLLCGYILLRTVILLIVFDTKQLFSNSWFVKVQIVDLPLLLNSADLLLMWFTVDLYGVKKALSQWFIVLKMIAGLVLAYLPISLLLNEITNYHMGLVVHLILSALLFVVAVLLVKHGKRQAMVYLVMMSTLCFFALWHTVKFVGVNKDIYLQNPYLYYLSFIMSSFLAVFILSRHLYYQLQDKKRAQQEALGHAKSIKKAQQAMLAMQEKNQEQLESSVQERTLELHIALQELEQANKELEELNTKDELTGLYNRRHYDKKIVAEHRRSRRNLTPLSLVIIDADHFKRINDNYGHLAGDFCLTWLADKIKQCLGRSSDLGFRYGGEEFCLILPETDTSGAISLAEQLRLMVAEQAISYQGTSIPVTISCGVATYHQQENVLPEHIFAAADKALYKAKQQGRNQVQQVEITHTLSA